MSAYTAAIMNKGRNVGTASRVLRLGSKAISLISGLVASAMILYSGYVLYDTMYTQHAAFSSSADLMQYKPEIIEDEELPLNGMGLGMLASINEDTAAWLTIDGTHIDYPVLQGENDLYYASHDLYGDSSLTGAIYLSCMNSKDFSDSYNMIYGHHMDNGAMFGDIDHFVEKEYFDAHRTGTLILPDGSTYDLNVFACVATDAYENAVYSVGNRDLGGVVAFARSNALQYEAGIGEAASKICVLSTCASGETNGRLVLYAAMDLRNDAPSGRDGDKAVVAEDEDPSDADGSDIIDDADPLNNGSENADIAEEESTEVEENDIPAAVMNIDTDDPGNGTPGEAEEIGRIEEIEEEEVPLAKFFDQFTPTGGSVGSNAWALVNLICLVVTVYLFLPVLHIRDKFSRGRKMRRFNEEQGSDLYEEERFTRRFRLGVALELADCILAVIAFLMTEDVTRPMTLIDRWTPLMILFLALCLIVDLRLVSYRGEDPEDGNVSMQLGAGAAQPAK